MTDTTAAQNRINQAQYTYNVQVQALIESLPKNPALAPVPSVPQVRRGATSGQDEGQPMYPGAQAPAPTAQPAGAPAVQRPSEDQIYQSVKGMSTPQALQKLQTEFGMNEQQAIQFLRKYYRSPGNKNG